MGVVERVRDIVEPLLARHSLAVYDVELNGSQLRVMIERPVPATGPAAPLDLDTIADATRLVSLALDEHDPIEGRYTLEVSSPGLERPLRTPTHFAGAVGSLVTVKTVPGTEGDRRVRGTLTEADDHGVTVDGRTLSYDEIDKARTVFEWGPADNPPKQAKRRAASKPAAEKKAKVR